ncbi:MarR family winged helix-turn-helix transcriptional regulator [Mangrovihabitans endophyticus]|uniref:MarR family transcriptional regulator n=1 Tax=Mangrovihabitans endophyticus TaxID=1751298 RepID=A0A8J3FQ81_9ACTN|nr:MarR family transcriptional regulator [Mangrovihabitans endophyticus]GGL04990.1 MarR family transcriptional regulator [Mangrovihabitans endophyticus]
MTATRDSGDDLPFLRAVLPRISQLGMLMNRSRLYERTVARAGITADRPALSVLITLHTAGQPLRVGEIAERMKVVGPHITRQLHQLERRALVRRVTDPQDQRARLVELTAEGSGTVERYMQGVLGWFAEAIADWSEADRDEFGRLLGRFADDVAARLAKLDED